MDKLISSLSLISLFAGLMASTDLMAQQAVEEQYNKQNSSGSGYTRYRDIFYDSIPGVDSMDLSLDVFVPDSGAVLKPVMVFLHGGWWKQGKKTWTQKKDEFFTSLDYVFVTINYRLSPNPSDTLDTTRVTHPIHTVDAAAAMNWIFNNINIYQGDTSRVCLIGHSAGAHIVSLLSTDESYLAHHNLSLSNIKCTCGLDGGGYDVPHWVYSYISVDSPRYGCILNAFTNAPLNWENASPITHVAEGKQIPEFMLIYQGSAERIDIANNFGTALESADVPVTYVNAFPFDHIEINQLLGRADTVLPFYDDTVANFFSRCLASIPTKVPHPATNGFLLQIHPNPPRDFVDVQIAEGRRKALISEIGSYRLLDVNAIVVKRGNYFENVFRLSTSDLHPGVFILQVIDSEYGFRAAKLIKL